MNANDMTTSLVGIAIAVVLFAAVLMPIVEQATPGGHTIKVWNEDADMYGVEFDIPNAGMTFEHFNGFNVATPQDVPETAIRFHQANLDELMLHIIDGELCYKDEVATKNIYALSFTADGDMFIVIGDATNDTITAITKNYYDNTCQDAAIDGGTGILMLGTHAEPGATQKILLNWGGGSDYVMVPANTSMPDLYNNTDMSSFFIGWNEHDSVGVLASGLNCPANIVMQYQFTEGSIDVTYEETAQTDLVKIVPGAGIEYDSLQEEYIIVEATYGVSHEKGNWLNNEKITEDTIINFGGSFIAATLADDEVALLGTNCFNDSSITSANYKLDVTKTDWTLYVNGSLDNTNSIASAKSIKATESRAMSGSDFAVWMDEGGTYAPEFLVADDDTFKIYNVGDMGPAGTDGTSEDRTNVVGTGEIDFDAAAPDEHGLIGISNVAIGNQHAWTFAPSYAEYSEGGGPPEYQGSDLIQYIPVLVVLGLLMGIVGAFLMRRY